MYEFEKSVILIYLSEFGRSEYQFLRLRIYPAS